MFRGADLPGGHGRGQDRWAEVGHAAVVLDGASSFTPTVVDAGQYVDALLAELTHRLRADGADLVDTLGGAIRDVAGRLRLQPGRAPSSTVLIARERADQFDVLALGDSTAVVHTTDGQTHRITDSRLGHIAPDIRSQYRARLTAGAGYDDQHRELLRELQQRQLARRNTRGGYWIAEADEHAAANAVVRSFPRAEVAWCVLATDGAQRTIDQLDIKWFDIAQMDARELAEQLCELHRWEEQDDPQGIAMPRAKRHDDKVLVTWVP